LGLDTEAFDGCLDSGKYAELVQSQTASGQQIGIQSTPSFLVNGQPAVGAQPVEAFE
jgi:protein-disulfide isomerase